VVNWLTAHLLSSNWCSSTAPIMLGLGHHSIILFSIDVIHTQKVRIKPILLTGTLSHIHMLLLNLYPFYFVSAILMSPLLWKSKQNSLAFTKLNKLKKKQKKLTINLRMCRNLPFSGRVTRDSRVRLPRKEYARSRHQRIFEENVGKTEKDVVYEF